jgi:hypothetical protein
MSDLIARQTLQVHQDATLEELTEYARQLVGEAAKFAAQIPSGDRKGRYARQMAETALLVATLAERHDNHAHALGLLNEPGEVVFYQAERDFVPLPDGRWLTEAAARKQCEDLATARYPAAKSIACGWADDDPDEQQLYVEVDGRRDVTEYRLRPLVLRDV